MNRVSIVMNACAPRVGCRECHEDDCTCRHPSDYVRMLRAEAKLRIALALLEVCDQADADKST